jgi:exonuclease SbcC
MKILKLRFKNLNSLRGEWKIDFCDPAYSSGVIFAITGPTGSGKTTILDAISLALYGKTPRLTEITKAANEILSRRTGECSSEVEIETSKGTYRCSWSQHRADKRPNGELQQPKHEISDVKTGKVIATKKRDVLSEVEKITGLTFDQFTRSILLAQGGFAAFLEAKPDERSPLLEQITGTEIYSRISQQVHQRKSDEERKLGTLKDELGMISVLSAEEENSLVLQKGLKQKEAQDLSESIKTQQGFIEWRKNLVILENAILGISDEIREFNSRKADAADDLSRFDLAQKAEKIEKEFSRLDEVRRQQKGTIEKLDELKGQLPQIQEEYNSAVSKEKEVSARLEALKKTWDAESKLIQKVRELDVKLGEGGEQISNLKRERDEIISTLKENNKNLENDKGNLRETTDGIRDAEQYLSDHPDDGILNEIQATLDERILVHKQLDKKTGDKNKELTIVVKQLPGSEKTVLTRKTALEDAKKEQSADSKKLKKMQKDLSTLLQKRELSAWREEEEKTRTVFERLSRLKESAENSKMYQNRIAEFEEKNRKLAESHSEKLKALDALQEDQRTKEALAESLEAQAELLARVRDLEAERKLLADNKPCPLCGSPDHPYARGNIPEPDKSSTELKRIKQLIKGITAKITKISKEIGEITSEISQNADRQRELNQQLKEAEGIWKAGYKEFKLSLRPADKETAVKKIFASYEKKKSDLREIVTTADNKDRKIRDLEAGISGRKETISQLELEYQSAVTECTSLIDTKSRLEGEIQSDLHDLEEQIAGIVQIFDKSGYPDSSPKKWLSLMKKLRARYDLYQQQKEEMKTLENMKTGLEARIQAEKEAVTAAETQLGQKNAVIGEREIVFGALAVDRSGLYGEKDPAAEEERIKDLLSAAETEAGGAIERKTDANTQLQTVASQIKDLDDAIQKNAADLQPLESGFSILLQNAGFSDETSFLDARLEPEKFEDLKLLGDSLKETEIQLNARILEKKREKGAELEKNLTPIGLEELLEKDASANEKLQNLQTGLGGIIERLVNNETEKTRVQSHREMLETQLEEFNRWNRLHTLIGSADGKKFRDFAQGLSFEILMSHANRHLQKMSDRYLLIRDSRIPLDLNVVDNYQAGEVRSTKNLSGGESFIVSLALALGLSEMASRNVRIDSLFLDEGFGTLDDEALDTALVALSELQQQEGKLIGVISHVPMIRERITTRISVERKTGGRSIIEGPGCRQISPG